MQDHGSAQLVASCGILFIVDCRFYLAYMSGETYDKFCTKTNGVIGITNLGSTFKGAVRTAPESARR